MLGSRFDLAQTMDEIARRNAIVALEAQREADRATEDMIGDHCIELELQLAEIARSFRSVDTHTGFRCPICDSCMSLSAHRVLPSHADLGVEQHDLECDTCGLLTQRAFHSSTGYDCGLR